MSNLRRYGLSCLLALAAPAYGHSGATARLVGCDAGDCVLVRGHRATPDAVVRINGRVVEAEGGASWQVRLPVATVREWSAPFARTLRVAVGGPAGREDAVRLPVGLLGGRTELASLVVRAR